MGKASFKRRDKNRFRKVYPYIRKAPVYEYCSPSDIEIEDAEMIEPGKMLTDIESPESSLELEDLKSAINDAIEALPADLRTAFTLREFSGLSYEDITEIMNCPVGTVRSRIFRAREAIDLIVKELL